jgi:hypothetical protein
VAHNLALDCCGPGRGAYGLRRNSEAPPGERAGASTEGPGLNQSFPHELQNSMDPQGSFMPPVAPQPTGGNLSIFAVTL